MAWNPDVYEKFKRALPSFLRFAKFGSGERKPESYRSWMRNGELTAKLAKELPGSKVLGVDSSAEMLQKQESMRIIIFIFSKEI